MINIVLSLIILLSGSISGQTTGRSIMEKVDQIKTPRDSQSEIKMTLKTPNRPVAESLPKEVKEGAMQVDEIDDVDLQLVWDPPWTKDMMSDAAKLELNL